MTKGMRVYVYDSPFGNCSNDGLSSKHKVLTLTGPGVPEVFAPTEDAPEIVLGKDGLGRGPACYPAASPGEGTPWMDGGSFVYSGDSRMTKIMPQPVRLHDRTESWELYRAMSRD